MNKFLASIVVLVVLLGGFYFYLFPQQAEAPIVEKPSENEGESESTVSEKEDLIRVQGPASNSVVGNPIRVQGEARGYWFFEASFPLIVTDWDGRIIGESYATAESEWMTEDYVPFSGTVTYELPTDTPYLRGTLIFKKDNPSGLPEHDDAFEIPILFESPESGGR